MVSHQNDYAFDMLTVSAGWPSVGLRFKKGSPVDVYLDRLLVAAGQFGGTFAV